MNALYEKVDAILPTLPGWCPIDKGRRLARLVVESGAQMCVELGVYGGRSLIAMGLGLKHLGRGHVDGIDAYTASASLEGTARSEADSAYWANVDYEDVLRKAQAGIDHNGLAQHTHIIRARSQDTVSRYTPETIDILHQDANHSEEVSTAEVRAWLPLVRPGGYWVFDDLDWGTTGRARELLERSCAPIEIPGPWGIFQKRL